MPYDQPCPHCGTMLDADGFGRHDGIHSKHWPHDCIAALSVALKAEREARAHNEPVFRETCTQLAQARARVALLEGLLRETMPRIDGHEMCSVDRCAQKRLLARIDAALAKEKT